MQRNSVKIIWIGVLAAVVIVTGCRCVSDWIFFLGDVPPHYEFSGTVTGIARRAELYTRDTEAIPATALTIVTFKGKIYENYHGRSFTPDGKELKSPSVEFLERQPTVYLVDRSYIIYPPDKYDGKRLEVVGTIQTSCAKPSAGGPDLFGPPSSDLTRHSYMKTLVVKTIKIIYSGPTSPR